MAQLVSLTRSEPVFRKSPALGPPRGSNCRASDSVASDETGRNRMKRLLLSGAMLGALLAFVGSAQAADKKTLVFVVNGASDFWKAAEAGVKKAQSELPNYNLDFKYPEQSSAAIQTRADGRPRRGRRLGHHGERGRSEDDDRRARPYRQAGGAVHHRQRRAQEQPRRLYRLEQHRRRQAGRRDRAEGHAEWRQVHGLRRAARRRQRPRAHRGLQARRSRARRSSSSTCAPTTSTRPAPSAMSRTR